MIVKITSRYLLYLIYTLLTCFLFLYQLITGNPNDRFWQLDEISDDMQQEKNQYFIMAPAFATGKNGQCVLTYTIILTHEFWALLIHGLGDFAASQVAYRKIMATWWIRRCFMIASVCSVDTLENHRIPESIPAIRQYFVDYMYL